MPITRIVRMRLLAFALILLVLSGIGALVYMGMHEQQAFFAKATRQVASVIGKEERTGSGSRRNKSKQYYLTVALFSGDTAKINAQLTDTGSAVTPKEALFKKLDEISASMQQSAPLGDYRKGTILVPGEVFVTVQPGDKIMVAFDPANPSDIRFHSTIPKQ